VHCMKKQMTRELLAEMMKNLSRKQEDTLLQVLHGANTGMIAQKEGVHSSTISKRVSEICKKFDEILVKQEIVDEREKSLTGLSNENGYSGSLNEGLKDLFSRFMPEKVGRIFDELDEPDGVVLLESKFYLERPPLEKECKDQVMRPGALIRIRGSRQTGKTSLMNRVLCYAADQGLQTVLWDLSNVEQKIFGDLNLFLKSFCQHVIRQLEIENYLSDEWDPTLCGVNVTCTDYFEKHILSVFNGRFVIALDNLDRLFKYPEICDDFLGLLRTWYGDSRSEIRNREIWQKLSLIISHSTEDYSMINVKQSPFNIGTPVLLPEFTKGQVKNLARLHGLMDDQEIEELLESFWSLVEGHPYLQRLWMYHIAKNFSRWRQIYEMASTDAGIYADHLRRLWVELNREPKLKMAMKEVIASSYVSKLDPPLTFHLKSLGLVKHQGENLQPYCQLYADYFS
jgi:AAA-like domain